MEWFWKVWHFPCCANLLLDLNFKITHCNVAYYSLLHGLRKILTVTLTSAQKIVLKSFWSLRRGKYILWFVQKVTMNRYSKKKLFSIGQIKNRFTHYFWKKKNDYKFFISNFFWWVLQFVYKYFSKGPCGFLKIKNFTVCREIHQLFGIELLNVNLIGRIVSFFENHKKVLNHSTLL